MFRPLVLPEKVVPVTAAFTTAFVPTVLKLVGFAAPPGAAFAIAVAPSVDTLIEPGFVGTACGMEMLLVDVNGCGSVGVTVAKPENGPVTDVGPTNVVFVVDGPVRFPLGIPMSGAAGSGVLVQT